MERLRRYIFGLVMLLLLIGCGGGGLRLLSPPSVPAEVSPLHTINRWSKHKRRIRNFHTVIDVTALYVSWNVRAARIADMSAAGMLTAREREEMVLKETFLNDKWHEFLLAVDGSNPAWLDLSKQELWRVAVGLDGEVVSEAAQIEEWVPEEAELYRYYKFVTPWSKNYRIRFAKTDGAGGTLIPRDGEEKRLELYLRSYVGDVELTWPTAANGERL